MSESTAGGSARKDVGEHSSMFYLVFSRSLFPLLYIQSRGKCFQKERMDRGIGASGRSHRTRNKERLVGSVIRSFLFFFAFNFEAVILLMKLSEEEIMQIVEAMNLEMKQRFRDSKGIPGTKSG